jgi:hypothetical protein
VLIRGVGPALEVKGVLADPRLQIFSGPTVIAQNDNWSTPASTGDATPQEITDAAQTVGAFSLAAGSKDAAVILTLAPGASTAQVSGVALIEIYESPE